MLDAPVAGRAGGFLDDPAAPPLDHRQERVGELDERSKSVCLAFHRELRRVKRVRLVVDALEAELRAATA